MSQTIEEFIKTLEYTWNVDTNDQCIIVYNFGEIIMKISMGEAIQAVGRKFTMETIRDLDSCAYIKEWQKEKFEEVTDILKK